MSNDIGRLLSRTGARIVDKFGADFRSKLSTQIFFERGEEGFQNDLFSWADLNALLDRRSVAPADLQLSGQGQLVPRSAYTDAAGTLDLPSIQSLIRDGASLILDGLDRVDSKVRHATNDVMRLTGETASCNLFVTFQDSQAFHSHFDEVDTIILQLEGTKKWQVHGPSEPDPLPEYGDSDPSNCPEGAILDTVLHPGDLLHVPRGWWHTVRGNGGRSMHVTFAFTRKTGFDLVRWIAWRALGDPRIRQSLDRWADQDRHEAQYGEIVQAFVDTASQLSIDEFLAAERSISDGWQNVSLPWSVTDEPLQQDTRLEVAAAFDPTLREDGTALAIEYAGSELRLPAEYERAVQSLLRARELTLYSWAQECAAPIANLAALARRLQEFGLVKIS